MGKGRYLKAAERACTRKARFETRAAAEAFVAGRYRAYRCVVCGAYHLTSGRGDRPEPPEPAKKEPPGPKLGDLDWSAVLDPKPETTTPSPSSSRPRPSETEDEGDAPRRQEEGSRTARCAEPCGKDGRVLLVVEGRLVKSRPVKRSLRVRLTEGVEVTVDDRLTVLNVTPLEED